VIVVDDVPQVHTPLIATTPIGPLVTNEHDAVVEGVTEGVGVTDGLADVVGEADGDGVTLGLAAGVALVLDDGDADGDGEGVIDPEADGAIDGIGPARKSQRRPALPAGNLPFTRTQFTTLQRPPMRRRRAHCLRARLRITKHSPEHPNIWRWEVGRPAPFA